MHMSVFPACTYVLYVSGIHGVWRCQVVVSHHVNRNPLLQKRQVFSQLSHLSNQIDSFKSVSQTILGRKNYGWLFLPWGIVLICKHLFASYTDCCWLVDNLLTVCQLSAICSSADFVVFFFSELKRQSEPGSTEHVCHPRTQEAETGGRAELYSKFQASLGYTVRPCFRNQQKQRQID